MSCGLKTVEEPQKSLQIYPKSNTGVSPFLRDKYEKDAEKYWDIFYKHHGDKFFKDRHYLRKEWDSYFSVSGKRVILEVGCGAGNTIFPLIAAYQNLFVYACDFSPRAVALVKAHDEYTEKRVCAFACDLTGDNLYKHISPSSVDIVTMIFVLSAVSPEKMPLVLQNVSKVLKPNGCILFRDYAVGDLAQERFSVKDQKICENFYVRGDGTRAFYFSNEFLETLFSAQGFEVEELGVCCKQVENRSRKIVMNRHWVQATFRRSNSNKNPCDKINRPRLDKFDQQNDNIQPKFEERERKEYVDNNDIDISDGLAMEMFGASPSSHEMSVVMLRDSAFKIKLLSKEYQHTCKSTGLMLWESARLMASILDRNPNIVSGKRVLELGCGCTGICSMVAARSANLVVATDADTRALTLLTENIAVNLQSSLVGKLKTGVLEWGNKEHIEGIKNLASGGFEVIIGTDVTYVAEAIVPLFQTARELIFSKMGDSEVQEKPALILCHVFRRVDEPSLLSAASKYGFKLADRWALNSREPPTGNIIHFWLSEKDLVAEIPSSALHILYFQIE